VVALDPARLAAARHHVAAVPLGDINAILETEGRERETRRMMREPTGRRPGGNPRCRACNKYQPWGRSACTICGYVDGVGYPGR